MALNERLNKFKQQQERCQTTLSSIAASQASISMPKVTPAIRPANAPFAPVKPLMSVKFSDDTERLQHINSVRKSVVGAQIKLVIQLLYKVISKRSNFMQLLQLPTIFLTHIFTTEQINEATYVDILGNKAVFDSLRNNPKVKFEGKHFSYKPTHTLTGRDQLLSLIKEHVDGIAVEEVKDAYPSVLEDLQALKESGDIWWLSGTHSQEDTAHRNEPPRWRITVDNDLKQLYREVELPRDMLDIEKELKKIGEKPLTDTAKRRALAEISGAASKSKARKKQRGITSKAKLTNRHLPELFEDLG
ncbi:hypothetical protein BAE44_0012829 [Dichanthelium oligosanthes]|uniref:TFIIE beta domain-containing protein n=1 Tax=Dichanthelium oligosanthes TaxID=888268 RepID=A0A1E5VLZ1_9POAL|nr:hypothetical protein BAE44_0012829 [Dichanthelium oligosanthes]